MAKKPETLFSEKVKRDLEELQQNGALLWFTKIQQVGIRGIPDYLICARGKFIALELKKSTKEKPDPLQQYNLNEIRACCGVSLTANPEDWHGALETIKKWL